MLAGAPDSGARAIGHAMARNDMDTPDDLPRGLEERLGAAAFRYLDRYETSIANLHRILIRRAEKLGAPADPRVAAIIGTLLARLQGQGLIDDRRYARMKARSLLRRGRSRPAIVAWLRQKGVAAEIVGEALEALDEAFGDSELIAIAVFARRRRLGPFSTGDGDGDKTLAAFARAGFSYELTKKLLAMSRETVDRTLSAV